MKELTYFEDYDIYLYLEKYFYEDGRYSGKIKIDFNDGINNNIIFNFK